ncbi:MAG: EexN family lipoprotein [Zoogloeaceae bacterium]|jgi:hypothetical protein|nr:EexN family lipoprotein [Zoogloeaceae bacterium]
MITRSRFFTATLIALVASGLAACGRELQSVEWYKEHDAERMEVIRECKADPDRLGKTENCTNAKKANLELLRSGNR